MNTVLYLSGHVVIWLLYNKEGVLADLHVETLIIGENYIQDQSWRGPHWLKPNDNFVDLVFDCEREEIERVPVCDSGFILSRCSNRKAIKNQLIESHPDSIIHTNVGRSNSSDFHVQHLNPTENQLQWLEVRQKTNITVRSVRSVTEIMAEFFCVGQSTCITISYGSSFIKHTFCQAGSALFTRATSKVSIKEIPLQFAETLNHLRSTKMLTESVSVFTVGVPTEVVTELQQLVHVREVQLAEDIFNQKIMAIEKGRVSRRKRTCVVAIAAVFMSNAIGGMERYRQGQVLAELQVQRSSLVNAIKGYESEAALLSVNAKPLARALMIKSNIDSRATVNPAVLLTLVARSLKGFQQLELSRLHWTTSDSINFAHSPVQNTSAVMKVELSGIVLSGDSITSQQNVVTAFAQELSGKENVANLRVMETPLTYALEEKSSSNSSAVDAPAFLIVFELIEKSTNDV